MEDNRKIAVEMTADEKDAFERFQRDEARKAESARAKKMREDYTALVDSQIESIMPTLIDVSGSLAAAKKKAFDEFAAAIELKQEIFKIRKGEELDVASHTFTNTKSTMRITLGRYQLDNYRDTAEEGIAIVKEYISGLARDEESKALVKMVLKLLAKDAKGTLKASRIIQLRRLADETGSERFIEGVKIIEEAYDPVASKTYVKAEVKGKNGEWVNIPLGMTES